MPVATSRRGLYYKDTNVSFGFFSYLSSVFPVFIAVIFLCFSFRNHTKIVQRSYKECKLVSSYKQRITSTRLQVCVVLSFLCDHTSCLVFQSIPCLREIFAFFSLLRMSTHVPTAATIRGIPIHKEEDPLFAQTFAFLVP